jgi:predicted  nucleic acid-binding Zn-ribbon protein
MILKEKEAAIEERDLTISRLQEQLQEQKQQVTELIKSVNAAALKKDDNGKTKVVKDSLEYKSLLSEVELIKQERDEIWWKVHLVQIRIKTNR